MLKMTSLVLATVCAAAMASAQMSTTEKSVSTDTNGSLQTTKESETKTSVDASGKTTTKVDKQYTTRLESAYKSAGVSDADIVRLRDIDTKAYEVIKSGDKDKVKMSYKSIKNGGSTRIEVEEGIIKAFAPAPGGAPAPGF